MSPLSDDQGETLIELLITIVIMAIGVTAVVAAMFTVVVGSDAHHSMAQGEVVLRDFGEAIKTQAQTATAYKFCPQAADLDPTPGTDVVPSTQAGSGWHAAITNVEYWSIPTDAQPNGTFTDRATCVTTYNDCVPTLTAPAFTPACDPGLQRVTYHVWNNRTDAGQQDITARVIVRRNNAVAAP